MAITSPEYSWYVEFLQIYSVVNDTMAILMYPSKHRPEKFVLPVEESINYLLVKNDHATFSEEPFLSKVRILPGASCAHFEWYGIEAYRVVTYFCYPTGKPRTP